LSSLLIAVIIWLYVQVTINPVINLSVAQAMDLRNLDISKLIDWSRLSYEIEKVVKNTFRTQEG